jgi:hypothetical protein
MKTTYIQFGAPDNATRISKDEKVSNALKEMFLQILAKLIPKANPDFDHMIVDVKYWLIECDHETGIPVREVGLDKDGLQVLKMPVRRNYGYWVDNNLRLDDFKMYFIVSEISKEAFERIWECDLTSDFEIEIFDYEIRLTGADGGHTYVKTEIIFNGMQKELFIYFSRKSDEQKIVVGNKIEIRGRLIDQGVNQSLSLSESKLVE